MRKLEDRHNGNLGVMRMTLYLNTEYDWGQSVNHKRVRRLMDQNSIKSNIRRKKHNRKAEQGQYLAENMMNQDFTATAPNQK